MTHSYYITPEEYAIAEQNGISRGTLDQRIRDLAWEKSKAITTPPREQKSLKEWRDIARANGIAYPTLQMRIANGWDPERAATEPLIDRRKHMSKVAKSRRIYPEELLEKAKANGISYDTFKQRVYCGWSRENAATIPVMTRQEINRIIKNEYGLATRKLRDPYTKHEEEVVLC